MCMIQKPRVRGKVDAESTADDYRSAGTYLQSGNPRLS